MTLGELREALEKIFTAKTLKNEISKSILTPHPRPQWGPTGPFYGIYGKMHIYSLTL